MQGTLSADDREQIAQRVAELLRDPHEDRWLDTRQASKHLGIHPDHLRKLYREGKVQGTQERPNAKVYFRLSDLDDYRSGRFHQVSRASNHA